MSNGEMTNTQFLAYLHDALNEAEQRLPHNRAQRRAFPRDFIANQHRMIASIKHRIALVEQRITDAAIRDELASF